jgi:hypothetical protein
MIRSEHQSKPFACRKFPESPDTAVEIILNLSLIDSIGVYTTVQCFANAPMQTDTTSIRKTVHNLMFKCDLAKSSEHFMELPSAVHLNRLNPIGAEVMQQ